VLVSDAHTTPGLFRPLTHVARTDAYVVAPIVRDGHAVGLLHADQFGSTRRLNELDRELLWTFAAGVGWVMGDIGRRSQRAMAHPTEATTVEDAFPELSLPTVTAPTLGSNRIGTLTAREVDVLQLMAEGASNAAIGEALVISQATVKSHVRHILRKLRAANRTEAVSLYLADARR
jgi:ATP/maltotriose-dependent transcriptional regulator MalT